MKRWITSQIAVLKVGWAIKHVWNLTIFGSSYFQNRNLATCIFLFVLFLKNTLFSRGASYHSWTSSLMRLLNWHFPLWLGQHGAGQITVPVEASLHVPGKVSFGNLVVTCVPYWMVKFRKTSQMAILKIRWAKYGSFSINLLNKYPWRGLQQRPQGAAAPWRWGIC